MTVDLGALLARSSAADLLPPLRSHEAGEVRLPLTLLAQAPLSARTWYLLVRDDRGQDYGVPAVVEDGRLRRAVAGDGAAEDLLRGLGQGLAAPLSAEVFHLEPAAGEVAVPVDQTNELVAVGGVAMVKWLLHPAAGEQPGAVRLRQLGDLPDLPRPWALVHVEREGAPVLVASVAGVVPDAEDGWDWAVDDVRAWARGPAPVDAALAEPARLGRLVARVHAALALHGTDRASAAQAAAWHERALQDLEEAGLDEATADRVRAALAPLARSAGTPLTGIHGDLHVGQVLRARGTGDLRIIDFDGNPLLTAEENLALQPAARDVAGMLASLDHVGRVVLHRTEDLEPGQRQRVLAWIVGARAAFLDAYRAELDQHGLGWLLDESLLHPLLVQQECREYAYARRYLPHWRYVPDAALPALLEESPHAP